MKTIIGPIGLLLALSLATPVFAQTAIRDDAGLFSAGAVTKATETANSIKKDTGRDVVVETLAELPAGAPANGEEFNAWAIRQAEAHKAKGVYVLIVKSPGKLFVKPDKATLKLLPKADADRVRDVMLPSFKEKKFDEGLQAGLDELRIRMLGNKPAAGAQAAAAGSHGSYADDPAAVPAAGRKAPVPQRSGSSFSMWMCIIPILLLVIGVFVMRRAMGRSQAGYNQMGGPPPMPGQQGYNPNYPGGMMPGGGGGGFGRGAMGGLLGGLGGAWLYDKMFRGGGGGGMMGGGNEAHGSTLPPDASSSGSDYSGSSGDFGDSSSSSGFDSGGGDFGGGDFGGGGDSGSSGDF